MTQLWHALELAHYWWHALEALNSSGPRIIAYDTVGGM